MARIIIACGGTGGHLFPGLAVAEELFQRGHQLRIYVTQKKVDRKIASQYPHLEFVYLSATGWPGFKPKAFQFGVNLWKTYQECAQDFKIFKPDVVLGMGGFCSAVPLWVGAKQGIWTFLHESNALPGKVTRWLAPRVDKVFLGLEECAAHLPKGCSQYTGTPVRASLKKIDRYQAAKRLDMDPAMRTLLVMGGSQGARGLNDLMLRVVSLLQDDWRQWQVIHLTGNEDAKRVHQIYQEKHVQAQIWPFCELMEHVYSLADLVVSRSGASSMSEMLYYGLPSILVPYPHAAEDHQNFNAEVMVKHGAAKKVLETEPDVVKNLARYLHGLMKNEELRQSLVASAKSMGKVHATVNIAEEVERALA